MSTQSDMLLDLTTSRVIGLFGAVLELGEAVPHSQVGRAPTVLMTYWW